VHVTWRVVRGLPSLRKKALARAVGKTILGINLSHEGRGSAFRVIPFSIQPDHMHLIVEADDKLGLTAGLRGLGIWIARKVNAARGGAGRVVAERYHAVPLTSPRQVRNTISYVLHNHRHHEPSPYLIDPFSSGRWFSGWAEPIPMPTTPSPVLPATTWLARALWRRHGPISLYEAPRA
jgi:hypothetical protein